MIGSTRPAVPPGHKIVEITGETLDGYWCPEVSHGTPVGNFGPGVSPAAVSVTDVDLLMSLSGVNQYKSGLGSNYQISRTTTPPGFRPGLAITKFRGYRWGLHYSRFTSASVLVK